MITENNQVKLNVSSVLSHMTTGNSSEQEGVQNKEYDGEGAMLYIVAVLVVYSLSIFILIGTVINKKSSSMETDSQIENFMKGLEYARQQHQQNQVVYARLKLPGNFVGMRSETRLPNYMKRTHEHRKIRDQPKSINLRISSHGDTKSELSSDYESDTAPDYQVEKKRNKRYMGGLQGQRAISCMFCEDNDDDDRDLILPAITSHRNLYNDIQINITAPEEDKLKGSFKNPSLRGSYDALSDSGIYATSGARLTSPKYNPILCT